MKVRQTRNGVLIKTLMTIAPSALFVAAASMTTTAAPAGEQDGRRGKQDNPQWRMRGEIRATNQLHLQVGDTLDLNAKQTEKIDKLFAARLVELEKLIKKVAEQEEAGSERMEEIRLELKEARDSGDEDRFRDLRDEMRQAHSAKAELRNSERDFNEKVIAELGEEQADNYRKLARRLRKWTNLRSGGMDGMRSINHRLRQIGITKSQMTKVRDIAKVLGPRFNSTLENPKARREVVADYREKILEMLDDEQREKFDELESQDEAEASRPTMGRRRQGDQRQR